MDIVKENEELTLIAIEDITKYNYKTALIPLGKNVRKLIEFRGMYISTLALAMKLDRRTVKKVALGDIEKIGFNTAKKINNFIYELSDIVGAKVSE